MKLTVISNYGAEEKIISDQTSAEQIEATMKEIDWKLFHQVVLTKVSSDYLEVGGNTADDGLSVMYQENNHQYFIVDPPEKVEQMLSILISYLAGDDQYKNQFKFD
jgi:hypothetical protein